MGIVTEIEEYENCCWDILRAIIKEGNDRYGLNLYGRIIYENYQHILELFCSDTMQICYQVLPPPNSELWATGLDGSMFVDVAGDKILHEFAVKRDVKH